MAEMTMMMMMRVRGGIGAFGLFPPGGQQLVTTRESSSSSFKTRTRSKAVVVERCKMPRRKQEKLPVLLFDIMDTIVRDPFYEDVPRFFGMSFKELIDSKHPSSWVDFEKGIIDEMELARNFFKDGRSFDLEGLKKCMMNGYSYIDGVQELLCALKRNNYDMHAFTNYPIWYNLIEEKLSVSRYLSWTFCSCVTGKRKPDPDFYLDALRLLEVDPENCIFIDDRLGNVEAAIQVGMKGLQFKNADLLRADLSQLGIHLSSNEQYI
ncbi:Flavin mononucleotide hydrolase 1, chloroplatic [Turnera subulata]|uniref:Flavin mononucleotide hydrolase 1, chloroplatic n=1 Tax=Turnera subulata TaxID=218843 RepID=A0A9Q0GEF0_9ROSI|nr:Flavin mononucleotide hydrolase 1, chloroplatic [Turnera subulata]